MREGEIIGDRFVLQRAVGAGGMGTVYAALDRESGMVVALKIVQSVGAHAAARFAREVQLLADMQHPAIVRYVASGEHEGTPYLAMQWLDGEDLGERLRRQPLTVRETLVAMRRVADALAHAHARGVVHRDIKPANIFLPACAAEAATVLDFGIARDVRSRGALTQTGAVIGTLGYLAPEQARGERELTPAADVFALGCVLFECLTGRPAFEGETAVAILAKILVDDAPSLAERRDDLPRALGDLVSRMLAREPTRRPADARLVFDALAAFSMLEGRAPTQRDTRSVAPSAAREIQFITVVVVSPDAASANAGDLETIAASATIAQSRSVQLAARMGGSWETLADGSMLIIFGGSQLATDRATGAARVALALRESEPGRSVVVATGRADVRQLTPVGEALERAGALVAYRSAEILLDTVTAGLLDSRFEIADGEYGSTLRGERRGDSERKLLGRATACVGRERELRAVEGTVLEAFETRTPAGILVIADAGVGKSRLQYELTRRLAAQVPDLEIWRCEGTPLGAGSPNAMLASLVRRACEIVSDEPLETRQSKLRSRVSRHLASEQAGRVCAFLGELIDTPFDAALTPELAPARVDGSQLAREVRRAWDDFVDSASATRPVLIVLEDLHWGDRSTIDAIDACLAREGRSLAVIALARPTLGEVFGDVWSTRGIQEIRLRELPRRACIDLARQVLGDADEALLGAIADRCGGHAFFLEEILRSVAMRKPERPDEIDLPETALAMLTSRLAHLESFARRVLAAASVLGETFWANAVAAIVGLDADAPAIVDALRLLGEEELVARRSPSRFRGEVEFSFRHAFVREAAYATLHESDLRSAHAVAGEWLARQGESDPRVLGTHAERGATDDAGWARTAALWNRAAVQAYNVSDNAGALALARRGLAAVNRIVSPTVRLAPQIGLQFALGQAVAATRGFAAPEVTEAFGAGLALARSTGDLDTEFHALIGMYAVLTVKAMYRDADAASQRALAIAERLGRPDRLLEAHRAVALVKGMTGDLLASARHVTAGFAQFEGARLRDVAVLTSIYPEVHVLAVGACAHSAMGRATTAREDVRQAIAFATEKRHAFSLAIALWSGVVAADSIGDLAWGRECAERALAVSREGRLAWTESLAAGWLGALDAVTVDRDRGLAQVDEAIARMRAAGSVTMLTLILARKAEALARFDPARARAVLEEAGAFVNATGERTWAIELMRIEAEVDLLEGNLPTAEALLAAAVAESYARSALSWELRSCLRRAIVLAGDRRGADAREALAEVCSRFTEGDHPLLREAKLLLS